MFYKIIEKKRDEWLNSQSCVVSDLLTYIERQGKMRDAQIDSIKTYLFLKIKCGNKPLWELFASGSLNSTDIDELEVNRATREVLETNPAALALWEYATITDENGNVNSPKLIEAIKRNPEGIDYECVLKELFFNVDYPDYLFSIPMGAGKTYLMAALIYLNLYFALAEPDNPVFAHNFILFVPSGLKSSIIPSLRDIQNFDPRWILPDPVATQIKNLIRHEWLQESSSASKSNIVKNPNARKISLHLANPHLMGLVAVTNAEKVILDRVDNNVNISDTLLSALTPEERKEYEATRQANELREQIGKIPKLCILIDEVHHASDDQKLRQVVNKWMEQSNFNSVLGFSGTPNMDPASQVKISEDLSIKCTQYANVVTYYPLIKGIGNFLKVPTVRYANLDSGEIICNGLEEFFEKYATTTYANGATAKIAVYAPSITVLEEEVYPEACKICQHLGINPADAILKYHKGNPTYKTPEDAQFEFSMLDSPLSKKRIILLVGIGREGWNCKSLTGVILAQRNACPQNMVLQISCRCLREEDNGAAESALIWLNKFNADKLNQQLQEQQYTTIKEFGGKKCSDFRVIERFSRMEKLKLPKIEYCQIKINYHTVETEAVTDIGDYLSSYVPPDVDETIIYTQGFDLNNTLSESLSLYGYQETINFRLWLDLIVKEGIGTTSLSQLKGYEKELKNLFDKIVITSEGSVFLNPRIDQTKVRSDVRKCFSAKRTFHVSEELIPTEAALLNVATIKPAEAGPHDIYVPAPEKVSEIIRSDDAPATPVSEEILKYLKEHGLPLPEDSTVNDRTYHYLPYHLDSPLENQYLHQVIDYLKSQNDVEFYFNGDETLTDFYIQCYSQKGTVWKNIGRYYPDFILLTRNADNSIKKVIIVETKGEGFAAKFEPRKHFMEDMFVRLNNKHYGCPKFGFLYIEDTIPAEIRLSLTVQKIKSFLLDQ